jgi:hypothetical protein
MITDLAAALRLATSDFDDEIMQSNGDCQRTDGLFVHMVELALMILLFWGYEVG